MLSSAFPSLFCPSQTITTDTGDNWKARSVRRQNFKPAFQERHGGRKKNKKWREGDRREAEKEKVRRREGRAAHWYDNLIFWALVWSSLRGHPSIIRPVTSSLSSSSAPTPLYIFICVCVCVWLWAGACAPRSTCVCVCVCPMQTLPRVSNPGSHAGECEVGAAVGLATLLANPSGIETYRASAPRHSPQRRTGHMQGALVCVRVHVCVCVRQLQ